MKPSPRSSSPLESGFFPYCLSLVTFHRSFFFSMVPPPLLRSGRVFKNNLNSVRTGPFRSRFLSTSLQLAHFLYPNKELAPRSNRRNIPLFEFPPSLKRVVPRPPFFPSLPLMVHSLSLFCFPAVLAGCVVFPFFLPPPPSDCPEKGPFLILIAPLPSLRPVFPLPFRPPFPCGTFTQGSTVGTFLNPKKFPLPPLFFSPLSLGGKCFF